MEVKFEVEIVNRYLRKFHTNLEIGPVGRILSSDPENIKFLRDNYGPIMADTLQGLWGLPDVSAIYIHPYVIEVIINEGRNWNETIDQIVERAIRLTAGEKSPVPMAIKIVNLVTYHIYEANFLISEATARFTRPLHNSDDRELRRLGDEGAQLVQELMKIDGVISVSILPLIMSVTIADKVFEWKDVEPQIVQTIKNIYGDAIVFSQKQRS